MKGIFSDKRFYFAGFGAVGGFVSATLFGFSNLESGLSQWVIGGGFDGMCIGALLAFGQARYVGKSFDWKSFQRAMFIGGIGGVIGGFVALYLGFPIISFFGGDSDVGRFIGWGISGVAVGIAVSKVVPNLTMKNASIAGAIGGLVGCSFMYMVNSYAAATASTGAAIGLVIAIAETVLRKAWLEVTVKPVGLTIEKEKTITVSLGDKPILLGCSSDCDVKLAEMPGAKAHFGQVSMVDGNVNYLDLVTEKSRSISIDQSFDVSNAKIALRTKQEFSN